jgi:hypothetical protein
MQDRTSSLVSDIKSLQKEVTNLSNVQYFGGDSMQIQVSSGGLISVSIPSNQSRWIEVTFTYDNYKGLYAELYFINNGPNLLFDVYPSPTNVTGDTKISWVFGTFNYDTSTQTSVSLFYVHCVDTGIITSVAL